MPFFHQLALPFVLWWPVVPHSVHEIRQSVPVVHEATHPILVPTVTPVSTVPTGVDIPPSSPVSSQSADPVQTPLVTSVQQSEWERVAMCEEGSQTYGDAAWHVQGPVYSGIGFLNATWLAYGGAQFAPNAGAATPTQQIIVGERIVGSNVPDQSGCSSW